ncbi:MAG: SH3 domain-containing protein [bacterium]|nr:SH3 domain-containing protein [bacterium]MDT8367394.1 SH3 domain-containing protein [bacterium]
MGDETINQKKEVVQGAKALGSLGQKYVKGSRDRLLAPVAHLTTLGRSVAGAAAAIAFLSVGLILFNASSVEVVADKIAVIDSQTVNIRKSPTTKAKVLTQAHNGDSFEILESGEKWTNIRSEGGQQAGWVANSLIRTRTSKTFVYRYDMKGYLLFFLGAITAFVLALRFGKRGERERGSWKVGK